METAFAITTQKAAGRVRHPNRSVNRTFRVDAEAARLLQQVADKKGVSVNSLVNLAIRKTVADAPLEGLRLFEAPVALLSKMMNCIPDEKMPELAESVSSFAREFVWSAFKEISLTTVLRTFEMWESRFGNEIQLSHAQERGGHTIILKHCIGLRWTKFLGESLKRVIKDLLGISVEIHETPNQIVARFAENEP